MPDEETYEYGPHQLTGDQAGLVQGLIDDAQNRYAGGDYGAVRHSIASNPHDPAFILLLDGHHTVPQVHRDGCYICEDPEFAAMGLPLCRPCPACARAGRGLGHVPADDTACDECEEEDGPWNYGPDGAILEVPLNHGDPAE